MPKISAPPPPPHREVVFDICHEGLGKTKKKLRQNQGPLRYEAGELPARDDVQLYGNVNPASITVELSVLNFKLIYSIVLQLRTAYWPLIPAACGTSLYRLYCHRGRRRRYFT
jgi:hypothetical protein